MSVPDGTLEFKVANEEYEAVIMNGAMGFEVRAEDGLQYISLSQVECIDPATNYGVL